MSDCRPTKNPFEVARRLERFAECEHTFVYRFEAQRPNTMRITPGHEHLSARLADGHRHVCVLEPETLSSQLIKMRSNVLDRASRHAQRSVPQVVSRQEQHIRPTARRIRVFARQQRSCRWDETDLNGREKDD